MPTQIFLELEFLIHNTQLRTLKPNKNKMIFIIVDSSSNGCSVSFKTESPQKKRVLQNSALALSNKLTTNRWEKITPTTTLSEIQEVVLNFFHNSRNIVTGKSTIYPSFFLTWNLRPTT